MPIPEPGYDTMHFGPLIPVETMAGRLSVLLFAMLSLVLFMALARRRSDEFFRGFLVAVGSFLSFDVIVIHIVFRLHRLPSGPEADYVEPFFILLGVAFILYGLRAGKGSQKVIA